MDTAGHAPVGTRKRGFFSARFMRSLSIGSKLWITTAILAVPLIVLVAIYSHSLRSTLGFTRTEQQGYELFQPLDQLSQRIVRREELVTTAIVRKINAAPQTKNLDEEAEARLAELADLDKQHGNAATHALLNDAAAQWHALKAAIYTNPSESMNGHERLVETLTNLATQIATDWNLSTDPETTAFNLIDVTTTKLPAARRFLGEARTHMVAMYAGPDYVLAEGARVGSLIALFNDRVNAAREEIKIAGVGAVENQQLTLQINELGNDFDAGIALWSSEVTRHLATGRPPEDEIRTLLTQSAKYSQSLASIEDAAITAAGTSLKMRYGEQSQSAVLALSGCGVIVLAGFCIMLALSRRIAGAIARLQFIAERITDGRYDSAIDDAGTDEISRLFASLNRMQQFLAAGAPAARAAPPSAPGQHAVADAPAVAAQSATHDPEHERLRAALDSVTGCVMVADVDGRIVYTNTAVDSLLRQAEADIRRELPSFSAAAVRGADFEIFHRRPQRHTIASLSHPHTTQIELGGHVFRLVVTPVMSAAGQRLGTAVEWADRTGELALEREVDVMLKAVLAGDLGHRLDVKGKNGFFEALGQGLNGLVANVEDIIVRVKATSKGVHGAAAEISQGNSDLSQRIGQQSASLEQTASSMEEITSTVKQNADNAHQANQLASAAREQAQAGGTVVNQAINAMADINESSKKIANIIGVIDEIAFQTNLLALNAAVEAARAGEQGRGFAVVASEVRSLAGRSAAAAKEIKELIRDSVGKVQGGSELVAQSGKTLEQIVIAVKKVTDVVAEIASASSEQTRGIEQVNVAIAHMDQMTQQNSSLVEQTSAASQTMERQAEELTATLDGYRTGGASSPPAARAAAPKARARTTRQAG